MVKVAFDVLGSSIYDVRMEKKTGKKSGQHKICSETPFSKNSYYIETSQLI